jgi:hypothetical protein
MSPSEEIEFVAELFRRRFGAGSWPELELEIGLLAGLLAAIVFGARTAFKPAIRAPNPGKLALAVEATGFFLLALIFPSPCACCPVDAFNCTLIDSFVLSTSPTT